VLKHDLRGWLLSMVHLLHDDLTVV
jgi:hypothetical protein